MNIHGHLLMMALLLLSGNANAQNDGRKWEAVTPGIVLTRNFMVPKAPVEEGFRRLPEYYRLGSKAYAKAPPDWWLNLAKDAGVGDKWHPKDFPLAYAGEFKATDGSVALLVVQVSQAFNGDGTSGSGPPVHLIARLFSTAEGAPRLLQEKVRGLGSMQFYRLLAGEAKERSIVFHTEGGLNFDSRNITGRKDWTLRVGDDHSLSFEEGEDIRVGK